MVIEFPAASAPVLRVLEITSRPLVHILTSCFNLIDITNSRFHTFTMTAT